MQVDDGTITILLGPNGAGKSTLIKSISGLLRYTGEITVNGKKNKSIEAKKVLGYIPELPVLYDALTVREHLEFIARAYGVENWEQKADALLERFELKDKEKKLGKELSKGMQQKVSICCALLFDPKVLIVDEPMVGLDPHAIKQLKECFKEMRDRGTAILISTHMIDSVEDSWDKAYIMNKGTIAAFSERSKIEESDMTLEDVFFKVTEGDK